MLGAIPYQPNEAVLHTDARMLPRRRRAWASWNYHLLDEPKPAADRHLPHEPPAVAARRARVLRDAQPHRGDRPGEGDPHDHLRPPGLHARRASPPRRAMREISGRNRTHFCGAYWGWGFHEDGVVSALRVAERFGGAAVSASASTRARSATGASPSRRREFSHRIALAYVDLDELAGAARRRGSSRRAARAACASAAATTSATRPCRCADAVRDAGARAQTGRAARRARSACSRSCARSATASTRSASTTASTPAASGCEALVAEVTNTPWGERHAYVLERSARLAVLAASSTRRCTSRRSWAWISATTSRAARPAETLSVHIESRDGGRRVRRDAGAAPPGADARVAGARSPPATRSRRCACSR